MFSFPVQYEFSSECATFLSATSAHRNKDAQAQIKNTAYQCIVACLKKIHVLYEKVNIEENSTGKGIVNLKMIRDEKKEQIIDFFDEKNWKMLNFYLGSPLPEVNDDTYFRSDIILAQHELGWKDLRNLIVWQLWIEKLWEMYPNFNDEIDAGLCKQSKHIIRNAIFNGDDKTIQNMNIEHLEIFKFLDNERKDLKNHLKETYLDEFKNTKNRVNWFMCKVIETTARRRMDLVTDIEIIGKQTHACSLVPKNLRHMMQFMSYISMNQKELSESLSTLDKLTDADEDWFMHTIGKTNKIDKNQPGRFLYSHTCFFTHSNSNNQPCCRTDNEFIF